MKDFDSSVQVKLTRQAPIVVFHQLIANKTGKGSQLSKTAQIVDILSYVHVHMTRFFIQYPFPSSLSVIICVIEILHFHFTSLNSINELLIPNNFTIFIRDRYRSTKLFLPLRNHIFF